MSQSHHPGEQRTSAYPLIITKRSAVKMQPFDTSKRREDPPASIIAPLKKLRSVRLIGVLHTSGAPSSAK